MTDKFEINDEMLEQVNGGMNFGRMGSRADMMAELHSKQDGGFRVPDEQQDRFDRFKDVFI